MAGKRLGLQDKCANKTESNNFFIWWRQSKLLSFLPIYLLLKFLIGEDGATGPVKHIS